MRTECLLHDDWTQMKYPYVFLSKSQLTNVRHRTVRAHCVQCVCTFSISLCMLYLLRTSTLRVVCSCLMGWCVRCCLPILQIQLQRKAVPFIRVCRRIFFSDTFSAHFQNSRANKLISTIKFFRFNARFALQFDPKFLTVLCMYLTKITSKLERF